MVRIPGGYVVLSTGWRVPRATSRNGLRFTAGSVALTRRPNWSRVGDMWASDMAQYGGRWLLYYAAPVAGLKSSTRCIGVAESATPTGKFRPLDERPLICPSGTAAPEAEDQFTDIAVTPSPTPAPTPTPTLTPSPTATATATSTATSTVTATPTPSSTPAPYRPPNPANSHGAIDPSFTVIDGRPYLLYKTDGIPSSLRALPLSANGLHAAGRSRPLLRSSGVIENPVLIKRRGAWYLITSEGNYGSCAYRTVWRRSATPFGWRTAKPRVLLSHRLQRLCGPGGADIVTVGSRRLIYFHAWTCRGSTRTCTSPLDPYSRAGAARRPARALFGGRLGFSKHGVPRITSWLRLPS